MNAIKMEKANKQAKTEVAIIKAFFWEHTATPFLSYKLLLLLLWLSPPAININLYIVKADDAQLFLVCWNAIDQSVKQALQKDVLCFSKG